MSIEREYKKVSAPYGLPILDVKETAELETKTRKAQEILRAQNFERIMPASLDYPETFSASSRAGLFTLRDASGIDLALRNDVTAQVIKGFVRQIDRKHDGLDRRFYYTVPVFRDVKKNYPSPREVFQLGAEIIGSANRAHFTELVTLCLHIMKEVCPQKSFLVIAHVEILDYLKSVVHEPFDEPLANRDAPYFAKLFSELFSIDLKMAHMLASWLLYPRAIDEQILQWQPLQKNLALTFVEIVNKTIERVQKVVKDGKFSEAVWQPLSHPRSAYYNQFYFEIMISTQTQPVARGGIYDNLIQQYADLDFSACGFAIDLNLI